MERAGPARGQGLEDPRGQAGGGAGQGPARVDVVHVEHDRVRAEDGGQPGGEGGLARPGRPVDADQPGRAEPRRGGVDALRQPGEAAQRRLRVHVGTGPPVVVTSPRLASRRRWASVSVTAKIRIRRSYWSQGRDQVRCAASCHGVEPGCGPDRVEQLGQPLLVVRGEGVDAVVEAAEPPFVGRQDLGRVQLAHGGQGVEEVAQRIRRAGPGSWRCWD